MGARPAKDGSDAAEHV